jgi:hypothetical protein
VKYSVSPVSFAMGYDSGVLTSYSVRARDCVMAVGAPFGAPPDHLLKQILSGSPEQLRAASPVGQSLCCHWLRHHSAYCHTKLDCLVV